MNTEKKEKLLALLYDEYMREIKENPVCENAGGYSFVLGDGLADSRVVLIGEAPGKDEVLEGRPFVGKAGGILNEFMEGAGIVRKELFITNAIKFRLAREGKGGRGLANRPAKTKEILQSAAYLYRELQIIEPDFIVTLGNVPLRAVAMCIEGANGGGEFDNMLGELSAGVGDCHGRAFYGALKNSANGGKGSTLVSLYHPASTIYNRSLKNVYAEDLENLGNLIKNNGL